MFMFNNWLAKFLKILQSTPASWYESVLSASTQLNEAL